MVSTPVEESDTMKISRRQFARTAGAGLVFSPALVNAGLAEALDLPAAAPLSETSKVALVHGDDRRKNVLEALTRIDDQIKPALARRKTVAIKVNFVSDSIQLAATHIDAVRGILDYLQPRFHGPVMVVESSAQDTLNGFKNFHYEQLLEERKTQKLSLVDLNREEDSHMVSMIDADLHIAQARLAARLLDPDTFVISSSMLKTHNSVVATMSVKNMVLGAALRSAPGQPLWSDKRKFHVGVRPMNLNMLIVAQKLRPQWGVAVIDGFEGMEGSGPTQGTPVDSRVAVASTDFVAADRVGLELMGINPAWVGYLNYCGQSGVGQYDLSKIEVLGPPISSVQKSFKLHPNIERELKWMGPLPSNEQEIRVGHLDLPPEYIYG